MACDWPVSATNGSTATLHRRELLTEPPVQTRCTALAETALPHGLASEQPDPGHLLTPWFTNIVGSPAPGSAGSHLVVIEAIDGGLPPAHTSVSLPLIIRQ